MLCSLMPAWPHLDSMHAIVACTSRTSAIALPLGHALRTHVGLAAHGRSTRTQTVEFGALGRERVREAARDRALALLREGLAGL